MTLLLSALAADAFATPVEVVLTRDVLYELTSDSESKKTQQIIDAIKATNARMESVEIQRAGDDITLAIAMFTDFGKASFRLVGTKPDYYRMAMGVNLDNTLDIVAKADKTIEPAGSDKTKETVVLKLNYRASDIPGASKIKVSKPTPTKTRAQLEAEKMEAAYQSALKENSLRNYRTFLKYYPDTKHRADVEKRIAELDAEAQRKAKAQGRTATRDKEIADAYAAAKNLNALQAFVAKYPDAPQAAEVSKRITAIGKDQEAYKRSRHSIKGLKDYLKTYPKGIHSADAEKRIKELEAAEKKREAAKRKKAAEEKKKAAQKAASKATASSIVARTVSEPPKVDGKISDPIWNKAVPVTVTLKPEGKTSAATRVEVRAVQSGGVLYLLARWPDKTVDRQYRPWSWDAKTKSYQRANATLDDGFAMAIHLDQKDKEACMLLGGDHQTDLWLWRAFWSDISGYGSDQFLVASTQPLRRANSHVNEAGKQVWIQNRPDNGRRAWAPEVPPAGQNLGDMIPSYVAAKPQGSAGDIRAKGTWVNGRWTVEMARALDTGNPDDAPIPSSGKIMVSFALYDRADKSNHTASELVALETKQ